MLTTPSWHGATRRARAEVLNLDRTVERELELKEVLSLNESNDDTRSRNRSPMRRAQAETSLRRLLAVPEISPKRWSCKLSAASGEQEAIRELLRKSAEREREVREIKEFLQDRVLDVQAKVRPMSGRIYLDLILEHAPRCFVCHSIDLDPWYELCVRRG